MLLDTCTATATTAKEGQDTDKLQEKEDSYPICEPEGPPPRGCKARLGAVRRYQATRTSMTEAGYVHRGDGRKKLGS